MTDQEQRKQRVELRIELEDAETNLAHLRVRTDRRVDEIEAVLRKIRENSALEPSRDDFNLESELRMRLTPEEFGLLKGSGDEMVRIIAELRQERQRVFRLRERDTLLSRSGIRSVA